MNTYKLGGSTTAKIVLLDSDEEILYSEIEN